jgi:hypothetical protein
MGNGLAFLSKWWFVVPWYAVGILGALGIAYDVATTNTALKPAMKWAWPVVTLFLGPIGIALYFSTARAPGICRDTSDGEKQARHQAYEENMLRRVNGAVIHCVAGDGLGIMTAWSSLALSVSPSGRSSGSSMQSASCLAG